MLCSFLGITPILASHDFSVGDHSIQIDRNYVSTVIIDTIYEIDDHFWIKPKNEECVYEIKRIKKGWFDWLFRSSSAYDAFPFMEVSQTTLKDRAFELHRFDPMDLPVDFFEAHNIPGLNSCDHFLLDERTHKLAFCKRIPLSAVLRIFENYSRIQYQKGYSEGHATGYSQGYQTGYQNGKRDLQVTFDRQKEEEISQHTISAYYRPQPTAPPAEPFVKQNFTPSQGSMEKDPVNVEDADEDPS